MFWLPVAFVCLTTDFCSFHQGRVSISVDECQAQNKVASRAMQQDSTVKAYKVDCLLIITTQLDSL